MEYKVEAASHLRRKFINAMLPSMIRQLGLENSKKCVVIKVENDCVPLGRTINLDVFAAYVIEIRPQSLKSIGATLAHEMVHVRQMAKGMLRPKGNGNYSWCGKHFGKNTKYMERPWELDAFARQEIILRNALEE